MIAGNLSTLDFSNHKNAIALIPFGAFEQHGPRLPLLTDTIIAEEICQRVELLQPEKILLYPAIWFGDSIEHRGFSGTLSVSAIDMIKLLYNLFDWLAQSGLRQGILYNAHGGNVNLAATACEEWNRGSSFKVKSVYAYPKIVRRYSLELFGVAETHAGSTETSLLYALRPNLRPDKKSWLANAQPYTGGHLALQETRELSRNGVLHKTDKIEIDPVRGEQIASLMTEYLINLIHDSK